MGKLETPPGARFTCQSCGLCCRNWSIAVTEEERQVLAAHDWVAEYPDLRDVPFFTRSGSHPATGQPLHRMRLRSDGTCPFLAPDGLCRIHKSLGGRAKPVVCRTYPYTVAYTPVGTFVGLRFSCPTVVANGGAPLAEDHKYLKDLARDFRALAQPGAAAEEASTAAVEAEWADAAAVERCVGGIFERPCGLAEKVELACRVLALLAEAKQESIRGRVGGFLEVMTPEVEAQRTGPAEGVQAPLPNERLLFRDLLHHICMREYVAYARSGFRARLAIRFRALCDSFRFRFNAGRVHLTGLPVPIPLTAPAEVASPVDDPVVAEMLTRYVLTKMFAKNYYGRLFAEWGQLPGLSLLLLSLGAIAWFARASAWARGARVSTYEDFRFGVRYVDYTLGASDLFARKIIRFQMGPILRPDTVRKLCLSYLLPAGPTAAAGT
ncbi:MAG: YkgJ family cysteine cluster protein [Planctomycetes bacterium]|nr:YkgJ family cysteine cluster protein [Planctomycetota bacterium]